MPTIAFSQSFPDLTDAKPKALCLDAASYETPVWSKVLEVAARALLESYHYHQALLSAVRLFTWFGHTNHGMTRPCELDKGLWIELNQGSKGIIVRTRKLLEACGYPLEKATLIYDASHVATAAPLLSLEEEPHAKPAKVVTSDSVTQPSSSIPTLAEDAFVRYVAEISTDNNAKKCRTGIRKISRILADMGLVKSTIFEIVALDQLQSATTTLRENAEYLSEDKRSNGWLKSPLNHYLHFAETALCNSCHTVLPQPPTKLAKPKPHEQVQPSSPEIPASTNHTTKLAKKEPYTAYPKRELFAALAEDRIPDEDFNQLLTLDGTRALLGMTPRHNTPVFALVHQPFFWGDPATRRGKPVFVTAQWFERDKARLDKLLTRWRNKENSVTPSGVQIAVNGIESRLAELLEAEFANGFRPRDFIDQMKFRKSFRQWFDEDLPEDFDFATIITPLGIEHDGKIFPRLSASGQWRKVIDGLIDKGNPILSFNTVMEREGEALMKAGIRSASVLRQTMLRTCAGEYEIGEAFFAPKGLTSDLTEVLSAATREDVLLSAGELASKFPFVEEADIRDALKSDKDVVWNQSDTYARTHLLEFDEEESAAAKRLCASAIDEGGFFPLAQLDLPASAALNPPSLTPGTLRRVFFRRFLSDDCDLHGGVVVRKDGDADALLPLHALCRTNAVVSLAQAEALANGCNIPLWRTISALHEEMVRVDGETFVSPKTVDFDVAGCDAAIGAFCPGDVIPLGAITSFANFPAVPGHAWNTFLLEGYLRRASAVFALCTASAGTKDVSGVIARRDVDLDDWREVFARAALDAGVEPDAEAVGDFLVANRAILRRSKMLVEVAARMSQMKEAK